MASTKEKLLGALRANLEDYCTIAHDYSFKANDPVVRLHEPTFGAEEIMAALECMLSTRVTQGAKVKGFENEYAAYFGFDNAVMSNSGSSANLLAIAALANKETADGLRPGDEVIVPALAWSTTVWPLIQMNLVPVVVDIDPGTLNIDPNEIERAISPKTRAVIPVHVYGNPCDMNAITDICARHSLILIEDCCEALGAYYDGRPVGKFGRVSTYSFYYSHHMTTFEGGICATDDFELAELIRILRSHGWVRDVEDKERWTEKYPDLHPRFLFVNVGYNLRATELQGAMGSVQLPKLKGYVDVRRDNAAWFRSRLEKFGDSLDFQEETLNGHHSWFGFPVLVKETAPFTADDMTAFLGEAGIETRPLICGNIALQPGLKLYEHRVVGDLHNATGVMRFGFSFGIHHAIDAGAREFVAATVETFMAQRGLN